MDSDLKASGSVAVSYFGTLRKVSGVGRETVPLNGANRISDVVRRLGELHGEPLKSALLDPNGLIREYLLISVGDEEIDKTGTTQVAGGDEISIFSPISGG